MPYAFDIQRLLDPAVYPWPVDEVELVETHISWVLLAGDRVVKLKRPVDLGFVDFRDPAKRKRACEDEVRLNRRLTDDVYLGVVPVTVHGVDAPGEPLEWATLMRRMPADRMLDVLLRAGNAPENLAELLAERLIPFHTPSFFPSSGVKPRGRSLPAAHTADAQPGIARAGTGDPSTPVGMTMLPSSRAESRDLSLPEHPSPPGTASPTVRREDAFGATGAPPTSVGMTGGAAGTTCPADPDVYLSVLTDNLDQLAGVASDILGHEQLRLVDRSMRGFMDQERLRLERRFPRWLTEGHGDLRCEHICLEPGALQIYDCVEFEIAIRCADIASDLAFLLMDLRRLDARSVAAELLERYRGAGFDLPQPVIDLYAAHRALVRAKVAALARSGEPAHDLACAFEAASYLDLASAFATPVAPVLVLVSGLSGSGKSTVAAALGRCTGGTVVASDATRKELAGLDSGELAAAEWQRGIYTGDWTARTYDRLLERANRALDHGRSAIVDATFLDNEQRERFVTAARERRFPAVIVWTELDDETARIRIERRAQARNSPSDATFAIRQQQQEHLRRSPLRIPEGAMALTIDTSRNGPASLDPFFAALEPRGLIGELRCEGVPADA